MNPESLDSRIDSVARHLTNADPPVDLQVRILAQLGEREAAPWWRSRWMPVAPAVLAVVLVAVVIGPRSPSSPQNTLTQSAAMRPGPAPAAEQNSNVGPVSTTEDTRVKAQGRLAESAGANSRISDVQAEWQARALTALPQPEALTFEGIQPDVLTIRPLETRPLVIMPIAADEDRF